MINPNKIKNDFSMFKNNPSLKYLDSAATSLTPDIVVEQINDYYKKYRSSINRGTSKMANDVSRKYEGSRKTIANHFNTDPSEIIFTKSTTTSINNISKSIIHLIKPNSNIVVTNMEHHSNFLPWQVLCHENNIELRVVKANHLEIKSKDVIDMIDENTLIVCIHHVSNIIGNTVDLSEISVKTNDLDVMLLVDGAQAAPHKKVDLKKINCDFYTVSAHKMCGPTGLGVLYINNRVVNKLKAFDYGGDMVTPSSVTYESFLQKSSPNKFEAGTPSIAEVLAFGVSIDYLNKIGMDQIENHEIKLKKYAINKLSKLDYVKIYNSNNNSGLIAFNINGVSVHDAMSESFISDITFDSEDIIIRDGQMCNNLTMKYVLKEKALLRASIYIYNDKNDIDMLVSQISKIYNVWR